MYKKGYQEFDIAQSNVVAKVKGVASTKNRSDLPDHYRRIWDTADYVIPPQVCIHKLNLLVHVQYLCQTCKQLVTVVINTYIMYI